jgi:SAM-dependent methyltransferase
MIASDEENLALVESTAYIDSINKKFYEKFQYPWAPLYFDCPTDPDFETIMLNQSIGSWGQSVIPKEPKIWVAGCGTNQAIYTALRFPRASVLGSDLSSTSLQTATDNARQLGISNLLLREESINEVSYHEEFDYIISTGVIHHNADPAVPMRKLATALKPTGVLEIMVYNRYHRILTTAFQKAIRILSGVTRGVNFEVDREITKRTINGWQAKNLMAGLLESCKHLPESGLADALFQPVEHSYTIDSFDSLATASNLELIAPCTSQYDKIKQYPFWNMEFGDPVLQAHYDSLPDLNRWQITNLLMLEQSPMIWFYLQRTDSGRQRKSEKELCKEFLDLRFKKNTTQQNIYNIDKNGNYKLNQSFVPYPSPHNDEVCRQLIRVIEDHPSKRMQEVLHQIGIETKFSLVNKIRLYLTTNAYPYLMAAQD